MVKRSNKIFPSDELVQCIIDLHASLGYILNTVTRRVTSYDSLIAWWLPQLERIQRNRSLTQTLSQDNSQSNQVEVLRTRWICFNMTTEDVIRFVEYTKNDFPCLGSGNTNDIKGGEGCGGRGVISQVGKSGRDGTFLQGR